MAIEPLLSSQRYTLSVSTAAQRIHSGSNAYMPFKRKSNSSPASVSVREKMPTTVPGRKIISQST